LRDQLVENLQARVLSLVFDVCQVPGVDTDDSGSLIAGHASFDSGFLDRTTQRPEIVPFILVTHDKPSIMIL